MLPDGVKMLRRMNLQFQYLILQIALLNQYNRTKDNKGRIVAIKDDVKWAINLFMDALTIKMDELDGSTRTFFDQLKKYVEGKKQKRQSTFTRREVRKELNISNTQLHRYVNKLHQLEYINIPKGSLNKGYDYKIIFWEDDYKSKKLEIKKLMYDQLDRLE